MTATLTVALWATNLSVPLAGIDDWVAAVATQCARARDEGAELLLLPEHVSSQWLSFAPPALTAAQEIPWLAGHSEQALARLRPLPEKYGLALLAGSWPVRHGTGYANRAHLLLQDGLLCVQDKLCLTPDERDPQAWSLVPGSSVNLIRWRGLKLAIVICLDIELPALAARLAACDLDLILVLSMTHKLAGYHRVFSCAKARAVELQAAVCAVGCLGRIGGTGPSCVAGASVFLPCEETLGHSGTLAELPPTDQAADRGPLLIAHDLPIAEIRALRHGQAEVWPGAWNADHLTFLDADA